VGSLQSGLYYGYLAMVDGILERLLEEMGEETKVVATGGLASLIGTGSRFIKNVDDFLTLEGLRIIWGRNAEARSKSELPPKAQRVAAPTPEPAPTKPWPGGKSRSR
jgi:type III pantothenate kinase